MFSPRTFLFASAALLLSACATAGTGLDPSGRTAPEALTGGEWHVEDVAGRGVVDGSPVTLLFGTDGSLSGDASCNRLIARYSVRGARIRITPAGTTMMACAPVLMDQERRLIGLLGAVKRYRIDRTGALVLTTPAGASLVARR